MRKCLIVRHGQANLVNRQLSELGAEEIEDTLAAVESELAGGQVEVWCSPERRASMSAAIFGKRYGCVPRNFQFLLSDENNPPQTKQAIHQISCRVEKLDHLIIVTHSELIRELPDRFRVEFMDLPPRDDVFTIETGQGWLFDVVNRGVRLVP